MEVNPIDQAELRDFDVPDPPVGAPTLNKLTGVLPMLGALVVMIALQQLPLVQKMVGPYSFLTYLAALVLFGVGGSVLRSTGCAPAWRNLRKALDQARRGGGGAFGLVGSGHTHEFLVYGKGGRAKRIDRHSDRIDLAEVKSVALVKDVDGQTGLVLRMPGEDLCVSGLEPMARIWSELQKDDPAVSYLFRDDEKEVMRRQVAGLEKAQQELIRKWLVDGEVVTDLLWNIQYGGKLETKGFKAAAHLVVTNLRVGMLGQTVETQHFHHAMRFVSHYRFVNFLLPLAERVVIQRRKGLRKEEYFLHLEMPQGKEAETPITLRLTPQHTGIFLPILLFKRPVHYVDPGASFLRLVTGAIADTWKWSLGYAIVAGGAMAWWVNESGSGEDDFIPLAIIAGALTPAVGRWSRMLENYLERRRSLRAAAGVS